VHSNVNLGGAMRWTSNQGRAAARILIALLTFIAGTMGYNLAGFAADVIPPASTPDTGTASPPETSPEKRLDPGAPPIPPSSIDPGIERRPPTIPDRRSAVPPPNVDPKMAVDPETAPPAEGVKPQGGTKRDATPPR
jgi:hypothetical protein